MPNPQTGSETPFLTDVATLRERARQHIEAGAVTSNYGADPKVVVKVLNEALATEIVCVLRYKRHYFMAQGIASDSASWRWVSASRSSSCNCGSNQSSSISIDPSSVMFWVITSFRIGVMTSQHC